MSASYEVELVEIGVFALRVLDSSAHPEQQKQATQLLSQTLDTLLGSKGRSQIKSN